MTVCTNSFAQKREILKWLRETGSDSAEATIATRLHDFGFRGSTSWESASIGGAAHLVNFEGSDTLATLGFIRTYYKGSNTMPLKSIPAAEHR
jgi:nicotinamide phosphoribosyltransferase